MAEFGLESKVASSKPKISFRQKFSQKERLGDYKNYDLEVDRDKCIGSFEPSNIFNTRNSSFWRLRNLGAWFKEQESYEDSRYLEYYQIKI